MSLDRGKEVVKDHSSSGGIMMNNEQEDEEDGRLSDSTASL